MYLYAVCFPLGCILTLPILDSAGPLGVGVYLLVFFVVLVDAGVVAGPSMVVKCISNYLLFCAYIKSIM